MFSPRDNQSRFIQPGLLFFPPISGTDTALVPHQYLQRSKSMAASKAEMNQQVLFVLQYKLNG